MTRGVPGPAATVRKMSVESAISEAFSELEELGNEMREWSDNLQDNFSGTAKAEAVGDAADTLEGLSVPDVAGSVADIEVTITDLKPRKKPYSRAARRDQAVYILESCVQALTEFRDDESISEDVAATADDLTGELENAKDEAEGIEFPGMYG